jgi:hypothetical protein
MMGEGIFNITMKGENLTSLDMHGLIPNTIGMIQKDMLSVQESFHE